MEVLEERILQRRAIFAYYQQALADLKALSFSPELPGTFGNRWLTCILVDETLSGGITRETIRLALEAENIEARPLWKPLHQQPVFEHYPYYSSRNVAEDLFNRGLCLPSGSDLTEKDLSRITEVIKRVFHKSRALLPF